MSHSLLARSRGMNQACVPDRQSTLVNAGALDSKFPFTTLCFEGTPEAQCGATLESHIDLRYDDRWLSRAGHQANSPILLPRIADCRASRSAASRLSMHPNAAAWLKQPPPESHPGESCRQQICGSTSASIRDREARVLSRRVRHR